MPVNHEIEFEVDPGDKKRCFASLVFFANRGDKVTFTFKQHDGAQVFFEGIAPFDPVDPQAPLVFPVGKPLTVRSSAPAQSYGYTVKWKSGGGGVGNGGGSVGGTRGGP